MFFEWLCLQAERQDAVGAFARYAVADRVFPRQYNQLYFFLLRYEGMPAQRTGVKLAHREWRKARRPKRHTLACPAYSNYQPPYEDCTCGAETR